MSNDLQQEQDALEALFNSVVKAKMTERKDDGLIFKTSDGAHTIFVGNQEMGTATDIAVGDEAPILLARRKDDMWWGSIDYAQALDLWDRLEALAREGGDIEGEIVGARPDSLVVDVLGVRALVPANQVDVHRVDDLSVYVGRKDTFRVLKFDTKRGELTLSRRKVVEVAQKENAEAFMKTLEAGQVHEGVVRTVLNYGAFININGVEGLLHKSNMTWGRLDDPREQYKPGQVLTVKVLEYDRDRDRLSLGMKQLGDDPWQGFFDRYTLGDTYTGKVVSLTRFGAFLELEPGIEGLLHVSEISWTERIRHPREVLKLDDTLEVKLLEADLEERRLRLSVRELKDNPWQTLADAHQPGEVMELPITSLVDFGFFVELQPGVEGLVHLSELSWTQHHKSVPDTYKVGDTVQVKLISIDAENTRASFSIKQLEDDPWDKAETIAVPGAKLEVTLVRLVEGLGAFAEVVPGVEGLVHISEVQEERFETLTSVLSEGQTAQALVISFDRKRQRISLSLKRDELTPEERDGPGASAAAAEEYSDDGEATTDLGALLKQRLEEE